MGALISLVFVMLRLMVVTLRVAVVVTVWMVQLAIVLVASMGSSSRKALPRLRL